MSDSGNHRARLVTLGLGLAPNITAPNTTTLAGSGEAGEGGDGGPAAAAQQWYEIADERVNDVLVQQVGVSEACVLAFARRDTPAVGQYECAPPRAPPRHRARMFPPR